MKWGGGWRGVGERRQWEREDGCGGMGINVL